MVLDMVGLSQRFEPERARKEAGLFLHLDRRDGERLESTGSLLDEAPAEREKPALSPAREGAEKVDHRLPLSGGFRGGANREPLWRACARVQRHLEVPRLVGAGRRVVLVVEVGEVQDAPVGDLRPAPDRSPEATLAAPDEATP